MDKHRVYGQSGTESVGLTGTNTGPFAHPDFEHNNTSTTHSSTTAPSRNYLSRRSKSFFDEVALNCVSLWNNNSIIHLSCCNWLLFIQLPCIVLYSANVTLLSVT